jgi:hypothetical protein
MWGELVPLRRRLAGNHGCRYVTAGFISTDSKDDGAENLFYATAYQHLHEFPCSGSSYFTSSLVVFLMESKTCLLASSR